MTNLVIRKRWTYLQKKKKKVRHENEVLFGNENNEFLARIKNQIYAMMIII